ncbi:hypothetical protein NDU88_006220 [Pleurodeles waltl]|uniref:Uncharacterized protein n=1 Tax=Pleurodeles waltl TaxID=8319 RepID=A0AAV7RP93_PLEWA|nr:hypothetical protein NDU88_006220 [Pleurodeles waltl]
MPSWSALLRCLWASVAAQTHTSSPAGYLHCRCLRSAASPCQGPSPARGPRPSTGGWRVQEPQRHRSHSGLHHSICTTGHVPPFGQGGTPRPSTAPGGPRGVILTGLPNGSSALAPVGPGAGQGQISSAWPRRQGGPCPLCYPSVQARPPWPKAAATTPCLSGAQIVIPRCPWDLLLTCLFPSPKLSPTAWVPSGNGARWLQAPLLQRADTPPLGCVEGPGPRPRWTPLLS